MKLANITGALLVAQGTVVIDDEEVVGYVKSVNGMLSVTTDITEAAAMNVVQWEQQARKALRICVTLNDIELVPVPVTENTEEVSDETGEDDTGSDDAPE